MSKVAQQCHKVDKYFLSTIASKPMASALLLGNLLRLGKSSDIEEMALINSSIGQIKLNINRHELLILWDTIANKLKNSRVLDHQNIISLKCVQSLILCELEFFKKLNQTKIISFGQSCNHYRIAMVSLIRRHLYFENLADPFEHNFNYEFLQNAGVEQNHLYLAQFLKQCESLPTNALVMLGRENSEIALLMLDDLYHTDLYFEFVLAFVKQHPSIRQEIASKLKSLIENYPLTENELVNLNLLLEQISIYPEFCELSLAQRVARNHQGVALDLSQDLRLFLLKCVGITTSFLTFPPLVNHVSNISTFAVAAWSGVGIYPAAIGVCSSALPVSIPIAAAGALTWMSKRAINQPQKEIHSQETSNLSKIPKPQIYSR
ncbi:MAG: hypothetical protein AB7V32_10415 [Candidatus Berkiella sp.]